MNEANYKMKKSPSGQFSPRVVKVNFSEFL